MSGPEGQSASGPPESTGNFTSGIPEPTSLVVLPKEDAPTLKSVTFGLIGPEKLHRESPEFCDELVLSIRRNKDYYDKLLSGELVFAKNFVRNNSRKEGSHVMNTDALGLVIYAKLRLEDQEHRILSKAMYNAPGFKTMLDNVSEKLSNKDATDESKTSTPLDGGVVGFSQDLSEGLDAGVDFDLIEHSMMPDVHPHLWGGYEASESSYTFCTESLKTSIGLGLDPMPNAPGPDDPILGGPHYWEMPI